MMVLTNEEQKQVIKRIAYMTSRVNEETTWQDILSMAYCEFMPDKTQMQGDLISQQIIDGMSRFKTMQDVICESPDAFVLYYLTEAIAGKNLEQQCHALYSIRLGMSMVSTGIEAELMRQDNGAKDWIDSARKMSSAYKYRGPVTEQSRDRLLLEAADQIKAAQMSDFALDEISKRLQYQNDQVHNVFARACDDYVYRAMCIMTIYTMAKNGELSCIPREVTIDQLVVTVCTTDAMRKLVSDVQYGVVDISTQRKIMKLLWVLWEVAIVACIAGVATHILVDLLIAEKITEAIIVVVSAVFGTPLLLYTVDKIMGNVTELENIDLSDRKLPVYNYSEQILEKFKDRKLPDVPQEASALDQSTQNQWQYNQQQEMLLSE